MIWSKGEASYRLENGRVVRRKVLCAAVSALSVGLCPQLLADKALAGEETVVVLVRHAEKQEPSKVDSGLTERGERRAQHLAEALRDFAPSAIVVTKYKRTELTATPTREMFPMADFRTITEPRGSRQHAESVAALIRDNYAGKRVLVVGHSKTLPGIISVLGGPEIPYLCEETEYSTLFVLLMSGNEEAHLLRARYGEWDLPAPAHCDP